MRWSLLHFLLRAFTAVCSSCERPRGRGVRSSTSPTSIALWMCHTFRWRPSSLFSCRFVRTTGWLPSISGRHTSRFRFTWNLVPFAALFQRVASSSSKLLCFGLSTAPQVFSRVMVPVSAILHAMGVCMRRYLDDWLVQSSSRESLLRDLRTVFDLCRELGVVINLEKFNLVPSQVVQYLGVVINTRSFAASPSPDRISRLLSTVEEFQSSTSPPASLWLSLLGILSLLAHLVPGGRLRMQSLQLCLNRSWDHVDLSRLVAWSPQCLLDLQWWLQLPRLSQGVSLRQVSPDLDFWSDASDVWWGAHLGPHVASGSGTSTRRHCQSMPGSCWRSNTVSSIFSCLCEAVRSQFSATTSLQ